MKIGIRLDGIDAVRATLDGFSERRMRAVQATALTRTAREIEGEWSGEIFAEIDRPTYATSRAVVVTQATAATPVAEVFIRDQAATPGAPAPVDWLAVQEQGGQRYMKKFELALQLQGSMLAGQKAVPGRYAELDAHGNVSRRQIIQVIAQLGRDYSPGYARVISPRLDKRLASARRTGRDYVAMPRPKGKLRPGIYQRSGRDLLPVFLFVGAVTYRKRTDLTGIAANVGPVRLTANIERAIGEHIARLTAAGRLPAQSLQER
jgi:hypothetical protein